MSILEVRVTMLRDRVMGFSLSIRRVVEIVRYPFDYNLYRLNYLRNRFIKNAIHSNVLINRLNVCYLSISKFYLAVRTILETV
jgi:hypothetical protein